MNNQWHFINTAGLFRLPTADRTSYLYFPLVNEAGMMSAITPGLHGDIKADQNHFLTLPVSVEDLHNTRSPRDFWVYIAGVGPWSLAGNSARQAADRYTAEADEAFTRLRNAFVDWNEIRVSTVQEVADVLRPLPQAGPRAGWIIGVLQAVFELNYSFEIGDMEKKGLKNATKQISRYFNAKDLETKGLKQAAKQISRFKQVNDFAVAWVVQRSLGGHAIPVDKGTMGALFVLGIVSESEAQSCLKQAKNELVRRVRGQFTVRH